jgi:hypothetical protein
MSAGIKTETVRRGVIAWKDEPLKPFPRGMYKTAYAKMRRYGCSWEAIHALLTGQAEFVLHPELINPNLKLT